MSVKKLSPQEQIELLKDIKSFIVDDCHPHWIFLCNAYLRGTKCYRLFMFDDPDWVNRGRNFRRQVPLFTFANAKQFGANRKDENYGGWFEHGAIEPRVAFLDWMIEENQKLIQE